MPTINGSAQDVVREDFAGLLVFENTSVPCADGDRVTVSAITEVNLLEEDDGEFSISLAPGVYKLTVAGRTRKFTVPSGSATYSLADLLAAASETPLPWLKQADTLDDLRAIKHSANLRLAYVVADGNGIEAFYRRTTPAPAADDLNGTIVSDDGLGGWLRTSIS